MFKKIIIILILLFLNQKDSLSRENITRAGIAFGGTALVSVMVEHQIQDEAIRLNIGFFEFEEICISTSAVHYMGNGQIRPYIGAGIANVIIFPEKKLGTLHFLNIPAGLNWTPGNDAFRLGAEADFNRFLTGRNPGGGKVSFDKDERWLNVPGVYCLWPAEKN